MPCQHCISQSVSQQTTLTVLSRAGPQARSQLLLLTEGPQPKGTFATKIMTFTTDAQSHWVSPGVLSIGTCYLTLSSRAMRKDC